MLRYYGVFLGTGSQNNTSDQASEYSGMLRQLNGRPVIFTISIRLQNNSCSYCTEIIMGLRPDVHSSSEIISKMLSFLLHRQLELRLAGA
jgi:hypothetical protein